MHGHWLRCGRPDCEALVAQRRHKRRRGPRRKIGAPELQWLGGARTGLGHRGCARATAPTSSQATSPDQSALALAFNLATRKKKLNHGHLSGEHLSQARACSSDEVAMLSMGSAGGGGQTQRTHHIVNPSLLTASLPGTPPLGTSDQRDCVLDGQVRL